MNGDHKKWKKQQSKACYKYYKNNMPDISLHKYVRSF